MKYYCDYCKSYLTHDTMSVRKSHLLGRNHIRFYCSYYELKAKENGDWEEEGNYAISLDTLNNGPGNRTGASSKLPPPLNLKGLPGPPPSVLNNSAYCKQAVSERTQAAGGL